MLENKKSWKNLESPWHSSRYSALIKAEYISLSLWLVDDLVLDLTGHGDWNADYRFGEDLVAGQFNSALIRRLLEKDQV